MKARSATELLDHLETRTEENLSLARTLAQLPTEQLRKRPAADRWNALECLEHLNRLNGPYHARIFAALEAAGDKPAVATFTSTWIGNKLASSMKPVQGTRPVPTTKKMNPRGAVLDRSILDRFLADERQLRNFIERAREVDLNRVKIRSPLAWIIRLRLGDALRLLTYHDWRHLEQACRAVGVPVPQSAGR
ncbi:DinB family protein [Lewinella sp. IMCC34183]|uniref:DinB family protein n=1 Tax=Lewinella sp. IMCC34183 TaxID=2248762 RepID=UPI000E2602C8|nr:DinB family protein [Lewinella sp. IMCC34183]